MRSKQSTALRTVVLILCSTLTVSLFPLHAMGDVKDRFIIHVGKPSVWSRGQAHYLLAKMHLRNQAIEPPLLQNSALDPNSANATRIQIIKTLLDIEAQFNERIGVQNRITLQERDRQVQRREQAQNDLEEKRRELERANDKLRDLRKQIAPLQAEQVARYGPDGLIDTTDDPKDPTIKAEELRQRREEYETRREQIAELQARIDAKAAEQTALGAQVTALETTANSTIAAPSLNDPELSTQNPPLTLPGLDVVKDYVERAIKNAPNPTFAASIALDNFIGIQQEVIAKQVALLKDEVGANERIVFLELPSSIYTVAGKADNYVAQMQWKITGYRIDKNPPDVSGMSLDDINNLSTQKDPPEVPLDYPNLQEMQTALSALDQERKNNSKQGGPIPKPPALSKYSEQRWVIATPDEVRAIEVIPRQSALNVNDVQATANRKNFLGVLKLLMGFGLKVNYQRQQELYENYLQQEVFASGFGKGLNDFGWTFGPLPGTKRIAPGVRTTYAVLVVPRGATALSIKATGVAFRRNDDPDYVYATKEYGGDHKVADEEFVVSIPSEVDETFKVHSIYYTPAKKGEYVTAIIKGEGFSPQLAVQVEDVPLTRVLSLGNNLNLPAGANRAGSGVRGAFEQVSSHEIILSFTMGTEDFIGTPNITLVSPERSSSINFLRLNVNEHMPRQRLIDLSLTDPMFVDSFSLKEELAFKPEGVTDQNKDGDYLEGTLKGTGLRRRAEIWVNGKSLKLCRDRKWDLVQKMIPTSDPKTMKPYEEYDAIKALKEVLANDYADRECNKTAPCDKNTHDAFARIKKSQLRFDDEIYQAVKENQIEKEMTKDPSANDLATKRQNAKKKIEEQYELPKDSYGNSDSCSIERTTQEYTLRLPSKTDVKELRVKYRQQTVRGFDSKEFTVAKKETALYKVISYSPNIKSGRARVDIRFNSKNDPDPRIVMPDDGHRVFSSNEDESHWRAIFEVPFLRDGFDFVERDSIPITIDTWVKKDDGTEEKKIKAFDIDLPVRPQVVKLLNPRNGKAESYANEQPVVTLIGFNLKSIAKIFFGDNPADIVGPAGYNSLLVKVPKGGTVANGEAIQVPIILQKADGTKFASAVYYTYLGKPIPVVVINKEKKDSSTQNNQ